MTTIELVNNILQSLLNTKTSFSENSEDNFSFVSQFVGADICEQGTLITANPQFYPMS